MDALTTRFPEILFEACASGGNRFDPGILCYCPQIWASDNTDAISRARIQEGYSCGYPMSAVGAHISSSPNHQTLRKVPLSTRFAVASFGVLGLEFNLSDLPSAARDKIKDQLTLYKAWRDVLQFGDFYILSSGNVHKWICVSEDRRRAVGMVMRELAEPNQQYEDFRAAGLNPKLLYRFYNVPKRVNLLDFGDLVNTVSPVHIKQDSLAHNMVALFVTLPGEREEYTISGAVLMNGGVRLAPAYGGTGFNENTRVFPDFSSRLYFMEAVDTE